jgi:hypothetical protein
MSVKYGNRLLRDLVRAGALLGFLLISWTGAISADNSTIHATLLLVDFYDDDVTVTADGRVLWSGKLTVPKENETIGLSAWKEIDVTLCSDVVVHSRHFVDSRRICLTPKIKVLVITGGKIEPHIEAREHGDLD